MTFTYSKIKDCSILRFECHADARGSLTAISQNEGLIFDIKRVFYLYDLPLGAVRGSHAHIDCHQILIAVHGSFEVVLDDGKNLKQLKLDHPCDALHIYPGIWATQINFSEAAVCLVLASHDYTPDDYIHDYETFKKMKQQPELILQE
jgi:dTDP-4-dehydrorhamnose 3,5-epimerase-like enzyme